MFSNNLKGINVLNYHPVFSPLMISLHNTGTSASAQNIHNILGPRDKELHSPPRVLLLNPSGAQSMAQGEVNHRNGSYPPNFAMNGIGEVALKVPRDRKGKYRIQVIPKSKQYEDELR